MARKALCFLLVAVSVLAANFPTFAANPNLVGTWEGMVSKISTVTGCSTESVTITIVEQRENLCRGNATINGNVISCVGILQGDNTNVFFSLYGRKKVGEEYTTFSLQSRYYPTPAPHLEVNGMFFWESNASDDETIQYDNFQTSGGKIRGNATGILELLLLQ